MRVLSNSHTHTTHVDGVSAVHVLAERALELGFTSLGFTEHARQPFDDDYSLSLAAERAYIEEVSALRDEYRGRLRIWLGIERDRYSDADRNEFEYVLGAHHYFLDGAGGFYAVDGDATRLAACVDANFGGDWLRAAAAYYDAFAEYIASYKPDIIAHFDLFAKHNRKRVWFDETRPEYLRMGYNALERMIEGCGVMELNTGGVVRSAQPYPYPMPAFIKRWRELGGRVIVASDCHRAHQLDAWFERADEYLKIAGFKSRLVLGAGDALFEEVDI